MQMSLREAIGEAVERAHDAGSLVFGEIKASILAGYALQDPLDETAIELGIIQEASRRSLPVTRQNKRELRDWPGSSGIRRIEPLLRRGLKVVEGAY